MANNDVKKITLESLKEMCDDLKKQPSAINLSSDEFSDIFDLTFDQFLKDKNSDFKTLFNNNLNNYLFSKVNKCVYTNLKSKTDSSKTINTLQKIITELRKEGYETSFELFAYLIHNNDLLNEAISTLMNQRKVNIEYLETLTNDYGVLTLLQVYCDVNNIQISYDSQNMESIVESETGNDNFGLYLNDVSRTRRLTYEEEVKYGILAHQGNKYAKEKLIESNLRLVISLANKTGNKSNFLDIVQEGNMGLIKASEKFNPSFGCKFSTYAYFWIKAYISRYLKTKTSTIHTPEYVFDALYKLKNAESILSKKLDRLPTKQELSEETGISVEKIDLYNRANNVVCSIYDTCFPDSDATWDDYIADENISVEDDAIKNILHEQIYNFIDSNLLERESKIIKNKYGFDNMKRKTSLQFASEFGVSRQRIEQLRDSGLNRLRNSDELSSLLGVPKIKSK